MKIIYFTLFIILYILLRLLISFLFVKKENFNNLDYAIFEPSGNLNYHFGNKFKYNNMNFNVQMLKLIQINHFLLIINFYQNVVYIIMIIQVQKVVLV